MREHSFKQRCMKVPPKLESGVRQKVKKGVEVIKEKKMLILCKTEKAKNKILIATRGSTTL